MMMLLSFVALGAVFGFVFSFVTLVENILMSRIISFVLDIFMLLSFAVVFFCFVIGFGTDGFRLYYFLLTLLGFVLYRLTVHRLFSKFNRKLVDRLSLKRRKFTKRLKKF
ncbi:spore cortex biosynthesis protein YabQ [Eubacterium sp.]